MEQVIIIAFFAAFLLVAIKHYRSTLYEYALASESVTLFQLVCTILATYIGGGLVLGIINFGYKGGMVGFVIGVSYTLGFVLAGVLAPTIKGLASRGHFVSFHDFVESTHGSVCKRLVVLVNFVVFFFFLAAQFVALATLLNVLYGAHFYVVLVLGSVFLIAYTAISGLKGVIATDIVQIMILSGVMLLLVLPALVMKSDWFRTFGELPAEHFTGLGMGAVFAIGALLFSGLSILVRIDAWQRIFAAESAHTCRKAFFISAAVIAPFFLLYTLLGMHAKVVFPDLDADAQTVPSLLKYYFPNRVLLVVAICSIAAAIISSGDSLLNVLAVNVVRDGKRWGGEWKTVADGKYRDTKKGAVLKRRVVVFTIILGSVALLVAICVPNLVHLIIGATSGLLILLPMVVGGLTLQRPSCAAGTWSVGAGLATLIGLFYFAPTLAFVPALLLACLVYVTVTRLQRESGKEGYSDDASLDVL